MSNMSFNACVVRYCLSLGWVFVSLVCLFVRVFFLLRSLFVDAPCCSSGEGGGLRVVGGVGFVHFFYPVYLILPLMLLYFHFSFLSPVVLFFTIHTYR